MATWPARVTQQENLLRPSGVWEVTHLRVMSLPSHTTMIEDDRDTLESVFMGINCYRHGGIMLSLVYGDRECAEEPDKVARAGGLQEPKDAGNLVVAADVLQLGTGFEVELPQN